MYGRSKLTIHESIEEGRELGGPGDRELQFEDEEDEPVGGGGMGGFQSQGNRSLLLLHRFLNCSLYTENNNNMHRVSGSAAATAGSATRPPW